LLVLSSVHPRPELPHRLVDPRGLLPSAALLRPVLRGDAAEDAVDGAAPARQVDPGHRLRLLGARPEPPPQAHPHLLHPPSAAPRPPATRPRLTRPRRPRTPLPRAPSSAPPPPPPPPGPPRRTTTLLEYAGFKGSFRNSTVLGQTTGQELDLGFVDDPIKGRA